VFFTCQKHKKIKSGIRSLARRWDIEYCALGIAKKKAREQETEKVDVQETRKGSGVKGIHTECKKKTDKKRRVVMLPNTTPMKGAGRELNRPPKVSREKR